MESWLAFTLLLYKFLCFRLLRKRLVIAFLPGRNGHHVDDELPRVRELAASHNAKLYYIVLTAEEEELGRRIRNRGDVDMIEKGYYSQSDSDEDKTRQVYL